MDITQAIKTLDSVEFYMDGGVQIAPSPEDYQAAVQHLKTILGIKEPTVPQIQWGSRFEIHTRASKRHGQVYPAKPTGTFAEIGKRDDGKRCIRLTGTVHNQSVDRVFVEGETAEYDSYNLSYMGEITAIGQKTVTIAKYGQNHKLTLNEFAWRNYDLDVAKKVSENHDTMMYI